MFKRICRPNYWIRRTTLTEKSNHSTITVASTSTLQNISLRNFSKHQFADSLHFSRRNMSGADGAGASPKKPKFTNRLAQEKSPYLLQHAHNPVDWYPWGDEAIQRARRENKVIFLSVGYASCHWCHVMEKESFESEEIAKILNENFISIKVDREERPDVDKLYMQFVLLVSGSGGWPMSVWLTPDLTPITAGTYFPPHDRWGMPSFANILKTVSENWAKKGDQLKVTGNRIVEAMKESMMNRSPSSASTGTQNVEKNLHKSVALYTQRFDPMYGGFGIQPKFPEVSRLNFLFHAYAILKDEAILKMPLETLTAIGQGGIHDHIGGGFSRYSVDRKWHVPHFEKMLYDQGQLMSAFATAYQLTHKHFFAKCADRTFRYLISDLRHSSGGFFAGEDADSLPSADAKEKVEGAFYAWSYDEVKETLFANEKVFDAIGLDIDRIFDIYVYNYDLRETGNVDRASDPHKHFVGKNILIMRDSEEETCRHFGLEPKLVDRILNIANTIMHDKRNMRPRPSLDTKMVCSWNGLVLSGLSKLANCFTADRDDYLNVAKDLVKFMKGHIYDSERKVLRRSCYVSERDSPQVYDSDEIDGFLDDYAFVIRGLLDYFKASLDRDALNWARELQDIQHSLFWDNDEGGYFFSSNSSNVILRMKEGDQDGAEPCGNSVSVYNLLMISHYTKDDDYRDYAEKILNLYGSSDAFGYHLPEMASAKLLFDMGLDIAAVVGRPSNTTRKLTDLCRQFYIPGLAMILVDPSKPENSIPPGTNNFLMKDGRPTVYLCQNRVCHLPVIDVEQFEQHLRKNFFRGNFELKNYPELRHAK